MLALKSVQSPVNRLRWCGAKGASQTCGLGSCPLRAGERCLLRAGEGYLPPAGEACAPWRNFTSAEHSSPAWSTRPPTQGCTRGHGAPCSQPVESSQYPTDSAFAWQDQASG